MANLNDTMNLAYSENLPVWYKNLGRISLTHVTRYSQFVLKYPNLCYSCILLTAVPPLPRPVTKFWYTWRVNINVIC